MSLITKEQLLEALNELPDGAEIRIAIPTHDHWRNVIASPINCIIEEVTIEDSPYCEADIVCDPYSSHRSDIERKNVFLLRGTQG